MYINISPFWFGVISTVAAEMAMLVIAAVVKKKK